MDTREEDPTNTVRPLRRRADDRMLAGVAGGLGDYTGLDPVIFRIGFIFLAVLGGAGVALYLLAWLLIPKANEDRSQAERALRSFGGLPSWVGIVVVALGAAILVGSLGIWEAEILWAVALIAVGFVLLRDEERTPDRPDSGPAPEPSETAAERSQSAAPTAAEPAEGTDVVAAAVVESPAAVAAPIAAPARPRRERSSLGWFTIAALLVAVGVAAVLENWDVLTLDVGQFFALALAVLGAGLLVGAWWGRARLLILLGVLLVPFVLASSLIDMPLRGTVGDSFLVPQTESELENSYEVLAGNLTLVLDQLRLEDDVHVNASVAMGDLDVIVPAGVRVLVDGTAKAGRLDFFGHADKGFDLRKNIAEGKLDAERTITLDIEAGIASVDVYWGDQYQRIEGGAD
jgi:phage shock protein PspC (stress-responsive transcriptional regulator)